MQNAKTFQIATYEDWKRQWYEKAGIDGNFYLDEV